MQVKTKHGQYCRAVSNLNDFEAGLTEKEVELCPIFFFDPKHLINDQQWLLLVSHGISQPCQFHSFLND